MFMCMSGACACVCAWACACDVYVYELSYGCFCYCMLLSGGLCDRGWGFQTGQAYVGANPVVAGWLAVAGRAGPSRAGLTGLSRQHCSWVSELVSHDEFQDQHPCEEVTACFSKDMPNMHDALRTAMNEYLHSSGSQAPHNRTRTQSRPTDRIRVYQKSV
jgi:hypothetical protein